MVTNQGYLGAFGRKIKRYKHSEEVAMVTNQGYLGAFSQKVERYKYINIQRR